MNHYDDYGSECNMCGKPMSYRYCGLCFSCEQIDNDVPDDPPLKQCILCDDLTRNRGDDGKPLCLRCEEEYWAHMADEHSGLYDEDVQS